jgi:hypothetical protein
MGNGETMASWNRGKSAAMDWLLAHIDYAGDECLIWPFARIAKGYGELGAPNRKMQYAHRVMCTLVNGPPPTPKHQTAHSCGRGHDGCVHPRHVSWKTNGENQLDRRIHGTINVPRQRLTVRQVEEIRARKGLETQASIAKRLGIKVACVEHWQRHDRPPIRLRP